MTGRKLKPEEKRAWAHVARTVTPRDDVPRFDSDEFEAALSGSGVKRARTGDGSTPNGPLRHPLAIFEADQRKSLRAPAGFARPADRGVERRVRRGRMEITGTLDLHGHTQAGAETAFLNFLRQHQNQRSRCVLVITGKGKRGEGVLRRRLFDWLNQRPVRALVSGYASAHQKHGGSGAFYVFLRRRPS